LGVNQDFARRKVNEEFLERSREKWPMRAEGRAVSTPPRHTHRPPRYFAYRRGGAMLPLGLMDTPPDRFRSCKI
jgi:hypothetical protein